MATETKNTQEQASQQQATPQQASQQQASQQQTKQSPGAMQTGKEPSGARELARKGSNSPSLFSLGPREILSSSPFELMRRFSEEMNRVFEDFGLAGREQNRGLTSIANQTMWSPAIEVFERDNNLVVRADLPGMNKDDVKVEVTDNGIVISGESKSEHEERGEGFYRSERSYGQFRRLIPLPENVDTSQIRAAFNNGVLEIVAPMPEAQQRRREIPIAAEAAKTQAASAKQT